SDELAEYVAWLEGERGLARVAIRTDYLFPNMETAARTTGFFFGDAFADRVRCEGWRRVPECTGLWWRRGWRGILCPVPGRVAGELRGDCRRERRVDPRPVRSLPQELPAAGAPPEARHAGERARRRLVAHGLLVYLLERAAACHAPRLAHGQV